MRGSGSELDRLCCHCAPHHLEVVIPVSNTVAQQETTVFMPLVLASTRPSDNLLSGRFGARDIFESAQVYNLAYSSCLPPCVYDNFLAFDICFFVIHAATLSN